MNVQSGSCSSQSHPVLSPNVACAPELVGVVPHWPSQLIALGMGVTSDQMLDLLGKLDKEDWSPKAS